MSSYVFFRLETRDRERGRGEADSISSKNQVTPTSSDSKHSHDPDDSRVDWQLRVHLFQNNSHNWQQNDDQIQLIPPVYNEIHCYWDCFPTHQKVRKFRSEVKWRGLFRFIWGSPLCFDRWDPPDTNLPFYFDKPFHCPFTRQQILVMWGLGKE